jgi:Adenylosuccinate lyase
VRSHVQAALENVSLWHERDISHSSVERVILPDATILCDYALNRLAGILDGLHVYPDAMAENLAKTRGLIFSQAVLLALARAGVSREDAYRIVQTAAMRVWKGEGSLHDLLAKDPEIGRALPAEALARCFDPDATLAHVDAIYERVFSG